VFVTGASFEGEEPDGGPDDAGPDGGGGEEGEDDGGVVLPNDGGPLPGDDARFVPYGALREARSAFGAVALADGSILVVGGVSEGGTALASIERFDPTTGRSEHVADMASPRIAPGVARLADGRVAIVGGRAGVDGIGLTTIDLVNPDTGRLECPAPQASGEQEGCTLGDVTANRGVLPQPRVAPLVAFAAPNKLVIALGRTVDGGDEPPLGGVEVFTIAGSTLTAAAPTGGAAFTARSDEARAVGADGSLLVVGGRTANGAFLDDVVRYDPVTNAASTAPARLSVGRASGGVALLGTTSALLVGGLHETGLADTVEHIANPFATTTVTVVPGTTTTPRIAPFVVAVGPQVVLVAGGAPVSLDGRGAADSVEPRLDAELLVSLSANSIVRAAPENDLAVGHVEGAAIADASGGGVTFLGGGATVPRRTPQPTTERYTLESNRFAVDGLLGPGSAFEAGVVETDHPALVSAGGDDPNTGRLSPLVRVFDAEDKVFVAAPPLGSARRDHTLTRLSDNVTYLVVGGRDESGRVLATATFYNLLTGEDRALPVGLLRARAGHTATALPDGKVLLCGGQGPAGELLDTCERFTPSTTPQNDALDDTVRFELVSGRMSVGRAAHTATSLRAGAEVLLVGGGDIEDDQGAADLYVAADNALHATGAPSVPRRRHAAVALTDDRVLVVGGEAFIGSTAPTKEAELFDRAAANGAGAFSALPNLRELRVGLGAIRLDEDLALIVGGAADDNAAFPTRALRGSELLTDAPSFEPSQSPLSFGRADLVVVDVFGRPIVVGGTHRDGRLASGAERRTPVFFVDVLESPQE
jgi:hypothetical protein